MLIIEVYICCGVVLRCVIMKGMALYGMLPDYPDYEFIEYVVIRERGTEGKPIFRG